MTAQPVIRVRGILPAPAIAKLVKGGREPSLAELLKLFTDRYGHNQLECEVELHLKVETTMKRDEI